MEVLSCREILDVTQGIRIFGTDDIKFTGISTDSRNVNKGDLFVPLVGERYDGHHFISDAFKSGAVGALTQNESSKADRGVLIQVKSTLKALGELSAYYRNKFNLPIIAVTGSVGKTGTKDMIAAALSGKKNVLKTPGNYNNEIGLPLTIFGLGKFHEAAVVEMGMSGFNEISRLSKIARPNIAVITNIGMSHIEKLGSKENILKAKLEILEGMNTETDLLLLNGDDELLAGLKDKMRIRTLYYGINGDYDYRAYNIEANEAYTDFSITIRKKEYRVRVPAPGIHNVHNAIAAIAVADELKLDMKAITEGLLQYNPGSMRLNIIEQNGIKVINDAYNACPDSMKAALDVMSKIKGQRRIAVLGDMLEMGDWADAAHESVGRLAFDSGADCIVTVGEKSRILAQSAILEGMDIRNVHLFSDNKKAADFLVNFIKSGDIILVKGSRGMKMEYIAERILKN